MSVIKLARHEIPPQALSVLENILSIKSPSGTEKILIAEIEIRVQASKDHEFGTRSEDYPDFYPIEEKYR